MKLPTVDDLNQVLTLLLRMDEAAQRELCDVISEIVWAHDDNDLPQPDALTYHYDTMPGHSRFNAAKYHKSRTRGAVKIVRELIGQVEGVGANDGPIA